MSALSLTCRRTFAQTRDHLSSVFATCAFFAASAVAWTFGLESAMGTPHVLAEVLASAVSPFLPVLAAFLTMDTWSEARRTGQIDLLLSIPVRERDLVLGKFFGVWLSLVLQTAAFFVLALVSLALVSPVTFGGGQLVSFLLAFAALSLQGLLWCAVGTMVSVMFTRGAVSACATLGLLVALPRGIWAAAECWAPDGRPAYGPMPFDAHVIDMTAGFLSSGVLVGYLVLTLLALLITSKGVLLLRFGGQGARAGRSSAILAIVLAAACGLSVTLLALRLDVPIDLSMPGQVSFSPRMRQILSESSGTLTATCFVPRKDGRFRMAAKYLRALKREADQLGGLPVTLRFVDPNWDVGVAERLVRKGVQPGSIVFERGLKLVSLPIAELSDSTTATAIQRVVLPLQRREICWTSGHGEMSTADYGVAGLSDIARELVRGGYRNRTVDLLKEELNPSECALVIVADAKNAFSRDEMLRIDTYLKSGGRLLVLAGPPGRAGLLPLLSGWGLRAVLPTLTKKKTLSGSDVIVSDFADHAISAPLSGFRIVLESPLAFECTTAAEGANGVDKIEFVPLARVDGATLAVALERGGGAGGDLSLRPTRIVAVGDPLFVANGPLAIRANANREFFLNAVAFLSGTDASGSSGQVGQTLVTGLDRSGRRRYVLWIGGVVPVSLFLILAGAVVWRRRLS